MTADTFHPPTRTIRNRACLAAALLSACALVGCDVQTQPVRYEAISGIVESVSTTTGQVTVRISEERSGRERGEELLGLITSDSELYINDRFSSFDAIEIGDSVELIGYQDRAPVSRAERFIISLARITRNIPLPPEPDLSPPKPEPTTQPEES